MTPSPKRKKKSQKSKIPVDRVVGRVYDDITTPALQTVTLRVQLAYPSTPILLFQADVEPDTKFGEVARLIAAHHGGSINEISVCVDRFQPSEAVNLDLSLRDLHITSGDCLIYYDFKPLDCPTLL